MMKIEIVVTQLRTFRFRHLSRNSMIPYKDLAWYLRNLLSESGVANGKKTNAISSCVSTQGRKTCNL